ncbi:MAG TPA: right-handed parallel beta-helix repeat-containing protein [Chitinispirillaceae bacterium]|nr:right-handed parallel beta-helix repeat-containing protein [Chitinispirillaceae bacterium]
MNLFSTMQMFFIFMIMVMPYSLWATNHYVSSNGNDEASGSENAPYKSITVAVSKAVPGDSIIVASGTYSLTTTIKLDKSGTADKRIFLISKADTPPILDFTSMSVADANCGFKITGNYWHIKKFTIKGAGDNGLLIQGGSNNIIEHCEFLENRDTGCQLKGGAANNLVINCDSHDNRDPDEGDADGFAPKMDVGSGNQFIGCRAWQNSDDGWDGYLRGTDNVNTRLENCWCFKNGFRKDGTESTGNGNGFKMGGSDDKNLKHNFTLVRCLAFQNRVKGFEELAALICKWLILHPLKS